jgi:hypothetical protein
MRVIDLKLIREIFHLETEIRFEPRPTNPKVDLLIIAAIEDLKVRFGKRLVIIIDTIEIGAAV